jgi:TPR repeat protein
MTASEPNLPDDFSDVEEISSGSGRLRVTLEITAAILILVGIYYLFAPSEEIGLPPLQQKEIDPIIRAQIDAAQEEQPATGSALPAEAAPSTAETAPAQNEPAQADGSAAREIIANQRRDNQPLSAIDALASEYQQQGRATDAYLLWFYAARQGDGEAAFKLATLHDPNHFQPGSSLLTEADATQAYKWYSAAAHQSIPQAAERLQALRATLKAQAEAGDLSARRLLLNWQ